MPWCDECRAVLLLYFSLMYTSSLLDEVFQVASEQSNSVDREGLVINSDLNELEETVFVYSMSVEFQAKAESAVLRSEPDPLSMSCMVLLIFEGTAVAASEIVRV